MSQLPKAPSSSKGGNGNYLTVEVTIHRCFGTFTEGALERKRDYFVKITIANEKKRTSKRKGGGNLPLEWNETLIFHNVEKSSLSLGLYYDGLFKTRRVSEITILLPEMQGDRPPTITRTTTFREGPQVQFTLCIKDEKPSAQSEQKKDTSNDEAKDVTRLPEYHTTMAEDTKKRIAQMSQADLSGDDEGNNEYNAIEEARQAIENRSTPGDMWRDMLEGMKSLKDAVSPISEVNPYANLACTIFFGISDPFIKQITRDDIISSLLDSCAKFCKFIRDSRDSVLGEHEKLRDVLKRANIQIIDVAYFVRDYFKNRSFVRKALKNVVSRVDDTIQEYCSKLEELKEEFRIRLALGTGVTIAQTEIKVVRVLKVVEAMAQAINLDDITYVPGAGLDTDKICLAGTRTEVIQDIMEWISLDTPESQTMWLCGGAGTGKSAIAHSVAAQLKQMGRLGSMFCFSDAQKTARGPTSLFPHIARDLADLDKNIRVALCNATENKADRTASGITTQFEKLVLTPANTIRENLHGPIVIIIDALDESGTAEERGVLLQVLSSRLKDLPPNFRVIITSRPDYDIQKQFSSRDGLSVKRMDSISSQSTTEDITTFVRRKLSEDPDVTEEMCQELASYARGLFQWARVACDLICNPEPGETVLDRYEELISPLASKSEDEIGGDTLLDYLYHAVLSKMFSSRRKTAMSNFKFVMARILTAFEPLSCNSLDHLLAASNTTPKNCKAKSVVMYLGSVLSGVDSQDAPIRPLHTSFRDFLTNPERSGEFFVGTSTEGVHLDLASASLSVMKKSLKFNICRLPTSHLANRNIPDIETRIAKYIPPYLSYACRFWSAHLCPFAIPNPSTTPRGDVTVSAEGWNQVMEDAHEMLKDRVLYWLEVLSLVGASGSGLHRFRRLYLWAKARNVDKEIILLIQDIEKFWSYFAKCIATSAAHIYVSALPFSPKSSLFASRHLKSKKVLSVITGQLQNYPSCLNIISGHTDHVDWTAWSPDGTRLVSGSKDMTIRVWNAESGEMLVGPLTGHTDEVMSVAFSPDGKRIASGSDDRTIRVWNAETGEMILGPLRGHTVWVHSVVFSPDGTLIASGSGDQTIRVWNSTNGNIVLGPLIGHTAPIITVAFSPQGTLIASGSYDRTIRVWSTDNGEMVLGPLEGHTGDVQSVSFSPDGSLIASGSDDKTIRIWSLETGETVLGPLEGHTDIVKSVAFSPVSIPSRVASASKDATVRVWNATNGEMVLGPLEGHVDDINSVAFSPDGTRLVTSSGDLTIRVWDAENDEVDFKPLEGHTHWATFAASLPGGTRIISASCDGTICAWNIQNGEMVLGPLRGHTDHIFCGALSPDGTRIASGSEDQTIRIWSVESGEMVLGPLQGHASSIWSVAFSPDGSRLVSASEDETIRVWNSETGETVLGPLYGHTSLVRSVVFSPDGARIVSADNDHNIRIWDAENGEIILQLLEGRVAALSPDGTSIVSGSSDGTIRLRDAISGEMTHGPLKGHTSWVNSIAFSPDGTRFASGSHDGSIILWNKESGKILASLEGHTNIVQSVIFSPDGTHIISGSCDNSIRLWNVGMNEPVLGASLHVDPIHNGLPPNGWRIKDGWSVGENGELLFYVPPVHQLALWGPRTELIVSRHQTTKLDMSRFVHGSHWAECFDSGAERDCT